MTISASYQNVQGGSSSTNMAITRNSTRYPANCPAPCPAAAIILPATFQPSTLTVQLVNPNGVFADRINQLDLKFSKTFKLGRVAVLPTLEIFNLNNSDSVVTYVSSNVLATSYLRPNSIVQGRIIGIGSGVRW